MAFAKLFFDANVPALKKLKDIVAVCVGSVTSVTQLESANISKSEITVIKQAGWTLSAASPLEPAGVANRAQYLLSAPCVNSSKTKYVALIATTARAVPVSLTGTNSSNPISIATPPSPSATSNVSLWIPMGSSIIGSTLQSLTFYPRIIENNSFFHSTSFSTLTAVDLGASEFYISATARKIIVFSAGNYSSSTLIPTFASVLEFPETGFTHFHNNVPAVHFSGSYITLDNSRATINYETNTLQSSLPPNEPTRPTTIVYRTLALCDWYSPIDRVRKNRPGDDSGFLNLGQQRIDQGINISLPNFQLQPFIDIRTLKGEGIHYMSSLTEFYYTFLSPTYVMQGDEITHQGSTWVLLTAGQTINSSAVALAIRKE
jgi:hypothetical protein